MNGDHSQHRALVTRVRAVLRRDPFATLALGLIGLQFIILLLLAGVIYRSFTLGIDFAQYSQAFSQIGHGNLSPKCTICGYSYIRSHFELIMWPLSLLYLVFHTPFALSVVQVASVSAVNAVIWLWCRSVVDREGIRRPWRRIVLGLALLLLLIDPLAYGTVVLDFHFEATAILLAALAGFALWKADLRKAWVFAVLCLLCGDIGGLYIVGIGLTAALAKMPTRKQGVLLIAVGVLWIGIIGAMAANKGSHTGQYAYLAGRTALPAGFGGAVVILAGLLGHPGRAIRSIRPRLQLIGHYLFTGGLIGIISPLGFGVPAVVLLTSALQQTGLFIVEPFQQFGVAPFVTLGTVHLLAVLLRPSPARTEVASKGALRGRIPGQLRIRNAAKGPFIAIPLSLIAIGTGVLQAGWQLPRSFTGNAVNGLIPAREAEGLRTVLNRTPGRAEVIASLPISGRFGARKYVYLFDKPRSSIPVKAHRVVAVLDLAHTMQLASFNEDTQAVAYLRQRFGARTVLAGRDFVAMEWWVPHVGGSIRLP